MCVEYYFQKHELTEILKSASLSNNLQSETRNFKKKYMLGKISRKSLEVKVISNQGRCCLQFLIA